MFVVGRKEKGMPDQTQTMRFPSSLWGQRASGVLLHITSLPSRYGIGDMGPGAFAWVDRLHEAGQSWWQALPLGPTGYGDSPYQALSSFAGNGLLISPELLLEDGLLDAKACEGQSFSSNAVDYGAVIQFKHRLLDHRRPSAWHRTNWSTLFCRRAFCRRQT